MRPLVALLCLLAGATPARARPFEVRDLLHLREVQHAFASPDGRHIVLDVSAPYASAPAFDNDTALALSLGRLWIIDLKAPRPLHRIAPEDGSGYVAGPFSPSGRFMVVGRFRSRSLELGVLTLRTGRVRWLRAALSPAEAGRTVAWRSEREILFLSPRPGGVPEALRDGKPTYRAFNRLWARQRLGLHASTTAIGSGRFSTPVVRRPIHLLRLDLRTGVSRVLAQGAFDDLELSSSGRYLALTAPGRDIDLGGHALLGFSDVAPTRRLSLVDLQTGRLSTPCPPCDLTATLLDWSPQRDALLVFARTADAQTWEQGRFRIIDAVAQKTRALDLQGLAPTVTPFGSEQLAVTPAAWRGAEPLVWAHPASGGRSDWYAAGAGAPVNLTSSLRNPAPTFARASEGALIFQSPTGSLHVAAPPPRPAAAAAAAAAAQTSARSLPGAGLRAILAPEVAGPDATRTTEKPQEAGVDVLLHGANWRLLSQIDVHGVVDLKLERSDHSLRLMRLNAFLASVEPADLAPITHAASDGSIQADWLYLPPHAAGPAPLIVIPYPGAVRPKASSAFGPGAFLPGPNPQWLAAQGYAALVPGAPRDPDSIDPVEGLVENVSGAVDAAIATGRVDGERIGVWGHSFGGWAALMLGERNPRIKAVIAESGPSDLVSNRGVFPAPVRVALNDTRRREMSIGWSEAGQGHLMSTPWQEPGRYMRASPVAQADRIQAPVLILFGDQDFLDLGQGEEMFSALKRLGKDARLVTFWGEGHIIQSPANLGALFGEVRGFLDRTLATPKSALRSPMNSSSGPTPRSP